MLVANSASWSGNPNRTVAVRQFAVARPNSNELGEFAKCKHKAHAPGSMVMVYSPVPGSDRVMTMRMRDTVASGCKTVEVSNGIEDQPAFVSEATTVRN